MRQADIIRMARKAGDDWEHTLKEDRKFLERFATLVAAAENEACAKVVDAIEAQCITDDVDDPPLAHVAAAIRARGQHDSL